MGATEKGAAVRDIRATDAWMSLTQAASELDVSRFKVQSLIVAGELLGHHVAGRIVVSRASVERRKKQKAVAAAKEGE